MLRERAVRAPPLSEETREQIPLEHTGKCIELFENEPKAVQMIDSRMCELSKEPNLERAQSCAIFDIASQFSSSNKSNSVDYFVIMCTGY